MSVDIVLALVLLATTVVVLATGVVRMDVAALVVLVLVAMLGLAPTQRALAGFANPAVVAVAGMFVLSAGLSRTGVADLLGRWMLKVAGSGEVRVVIVVTLVAGVLSGFMNNVGVAAMMLPVVVTIARKTSLRPSKLLIPMALGAQLGGFTTLIGTSPNLLAADALREAGLAPFGLFSFAPLGLVLLGTGTLVIALMGPRLLPTRVPRDTGDKVDRPGFREEVELSERLFHLILPSGSILHGKTLADSLIGSALGVHVLAIRRDKRTYRAPGPEMVLRGGDRILVQGRPDYFLELRGRRHLASDDKSVAPEWLQSGDVLLVRGRIAAGSRYVNRSAADLDLRSREGFVVLAFRRGEDVRRRTHFVDTPMQAGDELLIQGPRERLAALAEGDDLEGLTYIGAEEAVEAFGLADRLWALRVTQDSLLTGRTLAETRLGDAVGFLVLAVGRDTSEGVQVVHHLPGPDTVLQADDHLLVKTRPEDMVVLRGLQRLEVDLETPPDTAMLEGGDAGFVEAVLAPRSSLVGKTLRQVNFRSRFGLHAVAVVREGGVVQTDLRDEVLRFGDALLLYGSRRDLRALRREPDLILLQGPEEEEPDVRLAPLSVLITLAALIPVLVGWVPVAVGVLTGAVLMVITRCLTPDEAYRAVDWPILVLVAGMLSLGAALSETGTIELLGELLMGAVGGWGSYAVLAAFVLVTAVGGQIIPGTAVVVFMAPLAISGAEQLGLSPYPLVMGVAIAATSLVSPVAHPAHALVMAPAGYRMADYLRLGLPVTFLVLVLTVLVTPLFFPF